MIAELVLTELAKYPDYQILLQYAFFYNFYM